MRTLLFFDLPTITSQDLKNYRGFIKNIKKLGFYMIQESVYVKMSLDYQSTCSTIQKLKSIVPSEGNVMILNITEKQFSSMEILVGDINSDVITTDSRTVHL
jgi:CRISPR-associated protein Cas2